MRDMNAWVAAARSGTYGLEAAEIAEEDGVPPPRAARRAFEMADES